MPDRSLRLLTLPPQSPQGGERGAVLLRERPASPPDAPSGDNKPPEDDNPFAPPPEGAPDRPWQPRPPAGGGPEGGRAPWGSQWSDQQPGRSPGGFGERPGGGNSPEGGGPGTDPGKRWDPTDPAQRRARYALLCGMWAFFFALFGWPYVALLLGALALNWGISALRSKPRTPDPDTPEPTGRPQRTAAVTGLVTASLALALVAASFTAQFVYSDYYTCTNDALTNEAKQGCNDLLPKELKDILGANA
ncbi:hypothetical protein [Streptomyces sp. NPDC051677]|uniref:hypothetical protein n=1 Tax=Streptomyces sp. NPDC051677 TaxID=3365669 RepID=UPI0037D48224